jgi:CheY-like chemotaxis protein
VKVLLAEDNALIREIVTKTLRKMKVRYCSTVVVSKDY